MNVRKLKRALKRIARTRVDAGDYPYGQDDGATLAATRAAINALVDVLDTIEGVPAETLEERLTGPENSREEVVGTSTSGVSKNSGNSGFSGGSPEPSNGRPLN